MDLNGSTYAIADTVPGTGTTDSAITPATNTYEGFTAPVTQTTTIIRIKPIRITQDINGRRTPPITTVIKTIPIRMTRDINRRRIPRMTVTIPMRIHTNRRKPTANQTSSKNQSGREAANAQGTGFSKTIPSYKEVLYMTNLTKGSYTRPPCPSLPFSLG